MSEIDNEIGSDGDMPRKAVPNVTPAVSIAKRQTNRRRVLRTILLTGGVLGAALSGFLPLVYAQKSACGRLARWMKRTFSAAASNAASAFRFARCKPSSWPI